MTRAKLTSVLIVCLTGSVATATPPGVPAGAKLVAMNDCACSPPTDIDPDCTTGSLNCYRHDGPAVVTSAGTTIVLTNQGRCINCADCPCEQGATLTCAAAASVSATKSATATISSKVGVDAVVIKAELGCLTGCDHRDLGNS